MISTEHIKTSFNTLLHLVQVDENGEILNYLANGRKTHISPMMEPGYYKIIIEGESGENSGYFDLEIARVEQPRMGMKYGLFSEISMN